MCMKGKAKVSTARLVTRDWLKPPFKVRTETSASPASCAGATKHIAATSFSSKTIHGTWHMTPRSLVAASPLNHLPPNNRTILARLIKTAGKAHLWLACALCCGVRHDLMNSSPQGSLRLCLLPLRKPAGGCAHSASTMHATHDKEMSKHEARTRFIGSKQLRPQLLTCKLCL